MKAMINRPGILAVALLLSVSLPALAQDRPSGKTPGREDSLRRREGAFHPADSSRRDRPFGNDSMRRRERPITLFSDSSAWTSGEYMLHIEEVYTTLNQISNEGKVPLDVLIAGEELAETDTALRLVKENLSLYSNTLNLRNLQMYRVLLQNIQEDLRHHRDHINAAYDQLQELKKPMTGFRRDTVLRELVRDSALRTQFMPQLKEMRSELRSADSLLRSSLTIVNQFKTHAAAGAIMATELINQVNDMLNRSGARAFGKEYPYLWEISRDTAQQRLQQDLRKSYRGESKVLGYYFRNAGFRRLLMLLAGLLFFWWTNRNLARLKRQGRLETLNGYGVTWLPGHRVAASLVVMFCLAPLFDMHAPAVYVESMQFLMLIVLTFLLWRKWPRRLFGYWLGVIVLFVLFSFTSHVAAPTFLQRSWMLVLNGLGAVAAWIFLKNLPADLSWRKFIRWVLYGVVGLHLLAVLFNIWGRFSLSQIVGITGIFTFTQVIALSVFIRIWLDALVVQIYASRVIRGLEGRFDTDPVLEVFRRPVYGVALLLWLMVLATNLNIYTALFNALDEFLESPRKMGSINFTFGNLLLFFLIIWIAHLLQRSIGFLLGDTNNEEEDAEHRGTRSKLVVTRLLLLIGGYLLAIAASGLPIDKITIVLGALGVGIGMGLQNIVNNFVSGIVLVFDRRLRVGDTIEVGDKSGRVKEISLRSSTLATPDGAEVIIPNGDILSHQIVNWTLSNNYKRMELTMTVETTESKEAITALIREAARSSALVFEKREPVVLIDQVSGQEFGLKIFFWCNDLGKADLAMSEVRYAVYRKLVEAGISVK